MSLPHSTSTRNEHFDYVITLCNNVRATTEEVLTGGDRFIHRDFASPAEIGKTQGEILEEYRRLRDEIGLWVDELFRRWHQHREKIMAK